MPKKKIGTYTADLTERVADSAVRATSMSLPVAVHRRLDVIADLTSTQKASRGEIVAMLISDTDLDVHQLEQRLIEYRRRTVGDVLPPAEDQQPANVIRLRGPGRPSRPKTA